MNSKRTFAIAAAAIVIALGRSAAFAEDSATPSAAASQASVTASGMIVEGSAEMLHAGSDLVVAAVLPAVEASTVVLRDVATGSTVAVRLAGDVASASALALGTTVSVVVEATGASLVAAGKIVAFIPNAAGRALIHQARSTQRH